ncbi:aminoglycoside phosphotransferase [Arthrobacter crystallopoietes BAB-32]|uniref:Aminoglycoside phosphotransferase n=1 Tax=Arthrobacter crystallopoietes BAB-32 TaxID=1246476 RepID=N1V7W9_9MICC|nr:aminoglycoside phosphotransferase family protein [Arthrobacter crystallopoietes]EMY34323.1 aminoglycoside phosphotransferase [Arthrobacter crystallopoietes BAB-32]
MALMPAADIDITVPLVRRLLAGQAPDLASLPLQLAPNGWDNAMFRLGRGLAVRLPRREAAVPLLQHEQQWLPQLTAGLGIATPAPLRCGRPSSLFPRPWSVVPWIEGTTAARVPVGERRQAAADLGAFVAAFHRPAPADAPYNPVRGVPLASRDEHVRARLATGLIPYRGEVERLWPDLRDTPPWQGPPIWLHGDLHPENLILAGGGLAAVIDFGDLTAGDPATDLAAAWLVFDEAGRRIFQHRVNDAAPVDAATWRRARGWALSMATALLSASDDNPAMRLLGEEVLVQVLAG